MYVLIKDKSVIDVARVDPFSIFSEEYAQQFVQVDHENVEIGWTCEEGNFLPPHSPSIEELISMRWEYERQMRNSRLAACDWTQLADVNLSDKARADWNAYRQEERDLTKQEDPFNLTYPVAP